MSDAEENIQRCPAIRKRDGKPCTGRATAGGWCVAHDPQAAEWRARGGAASRSSNRAAKMLPTRLRPIAEGLERAFFAVERGELDPKTCNAMATLAGALVRVFQADECEQRLRVLEQQAAKAGLYKDNRGRDRRPLQWPLTAEG